MISKNPKIQQLMDEVHNLDDNDVHLEAKLQKIAEAVAAEQQKARPMAVNIDETTLTDPQNAFACEGCQ